VTLHLQNVPLLDAVLQYSAQTGSPLRNLTPEVMEYSPVSTAGPIRDQSPVGTWCTAM